MNDITKQANRLDAAHVIYFVYFVEGITIHFMFFLFTLSSLEAVCYKSIVCNNSLLSIWWEKDS